MHKVGICLERFKTALALKNMGENNRLLRILKLRSPVTFA